MVLSVFSIFDSKLGAYTQPFFLQTTGQAVRAFGDLVAGDTSISKHPEDYSLYKLAEFDEESGDFMPVVEGDGFIMDAIDFVDNNDES